MEKKIINPWNWQDQLGFSQAIEVANTTHTLYCAGQTAMDENGNPSSANMEEQINSSLDNLEKVLQQAGYSLKNVVRLNYYTTSIESFFQAYEHIVNRLNAQQSRPSSTLLEVKALAFPELLVEIEATAVK